MRFLKASAITVLLSGVLLAAATDSRLIDAARSGDAKAVRTLLAQHAPVTAADAEGSTPIHYAVQAGNAEIAGLLIAAGADVKAATRYSITPLSLACTNGDAA